MKKIGIIGGLSAESTLLYYKQLTRCSRELLGNQRICESIIYSVNTNLIIDAMNNNKWWYIFIKLLFISKRLITSGADLIIIPCNSLHILADRLASQISVPLLNIMNSVGQYASANNIKKILLLGTKFTMESGFYTKYLSNCFGLECLVPNTNHRILINNLIFNELCKGVLLSDSKTRFVNICKHYFSFYKVQGVVLGCTELSVLVADDHSLPWIDPLMLHIQDIIHYSIVQG